MSIGLLIIRVVVGVTLAAHGAQKLFGWFGGHGLAGTSAFMHSLGLRPARLHALAAGCGELFGGLLLALGLVTPAAGALFLAVMTVAARTAHAGKGFFATGGGIEYHLVLVAAALGIVFAGPGPWSLDALLGLHFAGWRWGVTAFGVGLVGAGFALSLRTTATGSPSEGASKS